MNLTTQEISDITISLETMMEQLNDDYQDDREIEVRTKYYRLWDLRDKLNK
jgi:hypothetical protein